MVSQSCVSSHGYIAVQQLQNMEILHPECKLTYKKFMLKIIEDILERFLTARNNRRTRNAVSCPRRTGERFSKPIFKTDGNLKFSDCAMCKLRNKRTQTGFECRTC